ncbi:MAG: acyl-CoA dehydrogenase C-terminal domain-containing protein [Proteobacteria bacterium]|nr:acyl-CoA dehydrogenase C-terminal domain-containing protein [Pseudomonadota bacterium]MDA1057231.1 acyl-CoA dehydrogenase C-terminal domain-containing protein [Pseudomonadota bacterium]
MADYQAPLRDMRFMLNEVLDAAQLNKLPGLTAATPDVIDAVLEEAGKLTAGAIGPLNTTGDQQGSRLIDGAVKTPDGFKEAYRTFVDGGWNGLAFAEEIGGQGLPFTVGMAVTEMITSSNLAFSLCPLLTTGAVEALIKHATPALRDTYLTKLVTGEWTGTMNLTEPHAGSDVGALRSRAQLQADGSFRITGTKIFITYGDHDMADNIIHLVLARTPGSPPGTKGISLFLVPKFLVNDDGSLGARNDLRCVSLEHKLGIHASPTAVMSFGDNDGAVGWLVGDENQGMRCMFTMMNHARLAVGLEGLAIADRAYQHALGYARERKQGRRPGQGAEESAAIIDHPDVRRMLMTMKATIEAMRGVALSAGIAYDMAKNHPDAASRAENQGLVDLLTPVVKAWCTDMGVEMASLGVQIHGGMGFIEETGAAQHYRDARIAPIYEGTNGIQALDLVGRKLTQMGGKPVDDYIAAVRVTCAALRGVKDADGHLATIETALGAGVDALEAASSWLREAMARSYDDAAAGATNYLRMFGVVAGGYMLARSALAAQRSLDDGGDNTGFYRNKILTARFFAEQSLPQAAALLGPVTRGATTLYAIEPELMGA